MNTYRMFLRFLFLLFFLGGVYQPAWADESNSSSKLQQIIENGTLRVGVSLFTPWVLEDKKGGLVGFEIDVAKKLTKDMGVTPKFTSYDWEQLIPALNNDEIDIIIAGMAITPHRALTINFSLPYATSGISLATNLEQTKDIQSVEELNQNKIKIAVISKTVSENLAKRVFEKASVIIYQKSREAEDAIVAGDVHAYMESIPIPHFIALKYPKKIDVPVSEPLLTTKAAFAIQKGDADFLSFLNSWVIARTADTWLQSTHEFWFESLQWQQELTR